MLIVLLIYIYIKGDLHRFEFEDSYSSDPGADVHGKGGIAEERKEW